MTRHLLVFPPFTRGVPRSYVLYTDHVILIARTEMRENITHLNLNIRAHSRISSSMRSLVYGKARRSLTTMAHFACVLRSCMTSAEVPGPVASSASKHRRKLSRSTRISEHSVRKEKHDVIQIAHTEIRKYGNKK